MKTARGEFSHKSFAPHELHPKQITDHSLDESETYVDLNSAGMFTLPASSPRQDTTL